MWLRLALLVHLSTFCNLIFCVILNQNLNTAEIYDPEYGVLIGNFLNSDYNKVLGAVYAINESAIQLVNFVWSGKTKDTFFWLDSNLKPTKDGLRLKTFEYGVSPIGVYGSSDSKARVVLIIPNELKLTSFKSFSLYSVEENISYGTVNIPNNFTPPKTQIIPEELHGSRYHISGVVQVVDVRTIRVIGFSFEGNKAPDGYFCVGQGLNVTKDSYVKAVIRGRDNPDAIMPMNERYTGAKDVYIELPLGYDIQHIDFLAIYSVRFDVVYASILLKNVSRYSIPPYVPPQKTYEEVLQKFVNNSWNISNLIGSSNQKNFTFQLGPSGGIKGYKIMHNVANPPNYVWYVNGYLANLYLKRNETYKFIVEGGKNKTFNEFNNPLYLTNDSYGGYSKLTNSEHQQVKIFAPIAPLVNGSGRLCLWTPQKTQNVLQSKNQFTRSNNYFNIMESNETNNFLTFADFRNTLELICDKSDTAAVFYFTPTNETPDIIYFQSYNNYQMGSKIFIVNEFPANLKNVVEEPYQYEAWRHQNNLKLTRESGSSALKKLSLFNKIFSGLFSSFIIFLFTYSFDFEF